MAQITSQNAAQAIVKLVAVEALEVLYGTLVMGQLVNRNFEAQFANAGDTINVPIPPVMTSHNIAEGSTVSYQNPNLGNAQITLNKHEEASFAVGDVAKLLSQPDLVKMYMGAAMTAVAQTVETDLMNLYTLATDNATLGGAAPISESIVDDAETVLFNAKVPLAEPKYLVVNAGTYSDLRLIQRFSENQIVPGAATAITEGIIMGKIKNFNVVRSHFVQSTAGPVYHNLAFSRDAFALVTRRLPSPMPGTGAIADYAEKGGVGMRVLMSYNPQTLSTQFTVDVLYGVGMLRNGFAVPVSTNT